MAQRTRVFYPALSVQVGPSPATGYQFQSGFNNVYTGGNAGQNQIRTLSRVQSVNDSWNQPRQNVGQLGQLAILAKQIVEPPTATMEVSWYVADVSNELICGLDVSGVRGALSNILDQSQADKNYFIKIAPEGIDDIGWTGNAQCKYVTNAFLASYSTQGAVGQLPTTTVSVQGFNWASDTGSFNRPLFAIDFNANAYTTAVQFTLPVAGSGLANAVPAIRPSEIVATISPVTGIGINQLQLQSYNISFNLNPTKLTKLGSFFPYSIQPTFPVDVTASITAYWGDLSTGSLGTLACNDFESNVTVSLYQPACIGQARGGLAAQWQVLGAKLDSQSFTEAYSDVASTVTLNYTSTLGGPSDTNHNLIMTGISA